MLKFSFGIKTGGACDVHHKGETMRVSAVVMGGSLHLAFQAPPSFRMIRPDAVVKRPKGALEGRLARLRNRAEAPPARTAEG